MQKGLVYLLTNQGDDAAAYFVTYGFSCRIVGPHELKAARSDATIVAVDAGTVETQVICDVVDALNLHEFRPLIAVVEPVAERYDPADWLERGVDACCLARLTSRHTVAVLNSLLRRRAHAHEAAHARQIIAGTLIIDPGTRAVSLEDGTRVPLSNTEFAILHVLAEREGGTVQRHEILEKVKGRSMGAFERSIDVHIGKIRRKLLHHAEIVTVRSKGYMLKT